MRENLTFYEKQSFRKWWLWFLNIIFLVYMIYNAFENHAYFSISELVISIAVPILLIILSFVMRLETKIDELGIRVKLFPFHIQFKYFPWRDIQKVYIRSYSPILEYGGWGLRFGFFGNGKAYNISGNMGLQIVFKNQKKLLIGTKKSEEMKKILEEIELGARI